MRTALIIGGTGFVGRHLCQELLTAGYSVSSLHRSFKEGFPVKQILADRANLQQMSRAIGDLCFDLVVDTCAFTARDTSDALKVFQGRFQHWVHISSAAVYLEGSTGPHKENDPIGGASHWGAYGRDKSASEDAAIANIGENNRLTILRPPYIYGPGNSSDRETHIWKRALQNLPVLVPKSTAQVQFLAVEDLAKFISWHDRSTPQSEIEIFNIGNPDYITLKEFSLTALEAMNWQDRNPQEYEGRMVEVDNESKGIAARDFFPFRSNDLCLSTEKISKLIGQDFFRPLSEGLSQTFRHYNAEELKAQNIDQDLDPLLLK